MSSTTKHEEPITQATSQVSVAFKPWRFDTRVQARNIVDGVLTAAEIKTHLSALPDVADKGATIHTGKPGEPDHASASDADDDDS